MGIEGWVEACMGQLFKRRSESGVADLPTLSVTMDRGLVRRDSIERKMETTLEADQHLLVRKGDIAYNMMRMWQGASGLAMEDGLVSPAYIVLKPTVNVDCLFASHFFKFRHTLKQFEDYSQGITADRLRLYYKDFAVIPTKIPPIHEQQRIADILSTWDRAIDLTKRLIAAKTKHKQALMQQLLTGKVRYSEFVKSNKLQRTPLGDMPLDWKKFRLGQIVEKVKRKNSVGEERVLTASGEFGLVDQREFFDKSVAGADLSGYYLLKHGEFAYNRSSMNGYLFGAIKRLYRYEQGVLSTLYICFGITGGSCDSNYLSHFFEACLLNRQLRGITQVGARAHGLLNITDSDFYSMSIVLPSSVDEQRKIAAVLDAQLADIEQLQKKLWALNQQKKGLMQQLLTGKVRVNVDAETVKG